MHRHDEDLIMDLAAGALSASEADEARREIEACADCRLDLQLQSEALAFLARAEPIELSEIEAARLRRNLDAELDHTRAAAAVQKTQRASRWATFRWGPAVAVAAVLIGVVFVAGNLSLIGGGGDADELSVAFEDAPATTASPNAQINPGSQSRATDGGERDDVAAATESAEAPAADEEFATESGDAGLASTSTLAASADAGDAAGLVSGPLAEILTQLEDAAGDTDVVIDNLDAGSFFEFRMNTPEIDCLAASQGLIANTLVREAVGLAEIDELGELQVIAHFGLGSTVNGVSAHDPVTCEAVDQVTP